MLRDDVIILTAIEAYSERSTRFTQAAFVCDETHSVDTARCALDQPL